MIPTTIGVALVVFGLYHIAPGDPATVMMGTGGEMSQGGDSEARVDGFRREHGLDRSLFVQFFDYIGPFNLSRDGHAWFTTPYTERKVTEVELKDGSLVREGRPLELEDLPGTSEADSLALAAATDVLLDDASSESARADAVASLSSFGDAAYPAVLRAMFSVRLDRELGPARMERLSAALASLSGASVDVAPERELELGANAKARAWFAWYYDEDGYRVRNTGERPWGGLLVGDLGSEMQNKVPVAGELWKRLKVTVPLSLISVILAYLIALPLGIFSVQKQGTLLDGFLTIVLFVLYSIPTFWAALMLILIFGATGLDWLPVLGLHDKDAKELGALAYAWDYIKHIILPVTALTYGSFAYLSRQMRAGMLDVIRQDYIRTARAKGLSERVVVYKHALRNSMIPILTLLASILPILIGGSVIVEKIFSVPGMGMYAFEGLLKRDLNIVMATTIFVGVMTQFGILLSDITYSIVDPRIRHD
ncbi:MAG: ABC transporter permease [Planctomycetes bacterium]|nr:ABC transporter permease [Planctomycetota bacterium]